MTIELEDHITLFVDFLGFQEASVQIDIARQQSLLTLLHEIASMRSEFALEKKLEDGRETISITPAITTFSDHIVLSYPVGSNTGDSPVTTELVATIEIPRFIGFIACRALPLGFLIRGGATVGKLYHKNGVVFGPAMVEAYTLESRTAIYPRVILSPALAAAKGVQANLGFLFERDFDGLIAASYMRDMILRSGTPGESYIRQVNAWIGSAAVAIESEVARLSNAQIGARAKWIWFAKKLDETIKANPFLFERPEFEAQRISNVVARLLRNGGGASQ